MIPLSEFNFIFDIAFNIFAIIGIFDVIIYIFKHTSFWHPHSHNGI